MDGVKAKLLLTDPPYGINAVHKDGKVHGDSNNGIIKNTKVYAPIIGDDTTDTAKANYDVALTCTENQIIFGGNYFTDFLPPSRCWIVWDKKVAGSFADGELAWTSFDRNLKIYEFMWSGMRRQGDRTVEGKTRVHPTQKPVGMLADILKDFSQENDSILDCFGGSGSTLIACEQLNRKCYMAELGPHYCDVILQRWENLTGKKAVLIDG
jgi:site-specific DNA-methyltransferase (adenine-specific)